MSLILNVKNCKNNGIQLTCNGAPSVGHAEGDQTVTGGAIAIGFCIPSLSDHVGDDSS